MADIVLVNPRFEASFWGLEYALPLLRKRANLPVACLPLLAALTPDEHQITLLDENVEAIDYARLERADIVGVTGMSVQRTRMREILSELKDRDVFTVVGGPWVTVDEDYFDDLTEVIFVGEAEETWPRFLDEWSQGRHAARYEQAEKTDMSKMPVPRYDLLKTQHYMFASLQFSRGCPFQCEFCDIIVTFGRRPRLKTAVHVVRELEAIRAEGMEIAFIVDDNLIGNKREIKPLLAEVAAWQQANGFPFLFYTEASVDLAEDPELMQLMVDANIVSVFVGIESPNEASLLESKKLQNVRAGMTLVDRVRTIQDAGLDVWCGMIVGFDHDDASVFDAQLQFARDARVLHIMMGMLFAIPKTPLYDRLEAEGRLDPSDHPDFGTNVIPALMTRGELRDGYVRLHNELYDPDEYFERFEQLWMRDRFRFGMTRAAYWRRHPWAWFKGEFVLLTRSALVYWQLMHGVPDIALRREYRHRFWRLVKVRRDPGVWFAFLIKCLMHYHHYTMAKEMTNQEAPVNTY